MTSALEFSVDLYAVFDANNKCSDDELKRIYQKLILKYHPDKIDRDLPKHEKDKYLDRFIEIDKAWKILGHAEKRKEYDAKCQENAVSRKWPMNSEIDLDEMDYNEGEVKNMSLLRRACPQR
uniref:DnaJ homolog subfamily C member 24-like n=1 Tax=Saccoglossus kowalevskii TaxID=10224 RepID=A0ABM0N0W5_SACKO|nr:PREDICTED: dnaJ homolog subfamily C member 24-like [Saccoglossus kowalevskii]